MSIIIQKKYPVFKSTTQVTQNDIAQKSAEYQNDTVEISGKKQTKKHKGLKIGLCAIATILATVITSIILFPNQAIKLLARFGNLLRQKTPKNPVNFKDAKTVDEAMKFAKEILGIKVKCVGNEDIDLELLNYINKGMVNFSNKSKGNHYLPPEIVIKDIPEKPYGLANVDGLTKTMTFNRTYYKNMDKSINEMSQNLKDLLKAYENNSEKNMIIDLLNKFEKGDVKTLEEKIDIQEKCREVIHLIEHDTSPIKNLQKIINNSDYKEALIKANLLTEKDGKIFIDNLMGGKFAFKDGLPEQHIEPRFMNLIYNHISTTLNCKKILDPIVRSPFTTIYHELGHINDKNMLNRTPWGEGFCKDALIAENVSSYASEHPDEFIAETFARYCDGQKLPQRILDLYEKLNGPKLP